MPVIYVDNLLLFSQIIRLIMKLCQKIEQFRLIIYFSHLHNNNNNNNNKLPFFILYTDWTAVVCQR